MVVPWTNYQRNLTEHHACIKNQTQALKLVDGLMKIFVSFRFVQKSIQLQTTTIQNTFDEKSENQRKNSRIASTNRKFVTNRWFSFSLLSFVGFEKWKKHRLDDASKSSFAFSNVFECSISTNRNELSSN